MPKKDKDNDGNNSEKDNEIRLPQNIVLVGETVLDDKNIYIKQSTYKEIHKFTRDKTKNESGGILIGDVIEQFGKVNILVSAFIEAKYCEATPTTLTFTHKTWEYCHKEIEKKYPKKIIVGWIHTHPDFGIFLSEYDKFIQQNFFKEPNQIAYVIDPIREDEGFYFWINENIERCKGFYIYDETGKKIDAVEEEQDDTEYDYDSKDSSSLKPYIAITALGAIVVILLVNVVMLSARLSRLENISSENFKNIELAISSMNVVISNMNAKINSNDDVQSLESTSEVSSVDSTNETITELPTEVSTENQASSTEQTSISETTTEIITEATTQLVQ